MNKLYKIRSKATGLFSAGGAHPTWERVGKIWTTAGGLSGHFTNLNAAGRKEYRNNDAEVVEIEIVATAAKPVDEFINAVNMRKQAREARAQEKVKMRLNDDQLRIELIASKLHLKSK